MGRQNYYKQKQESKQTYNGIQMCSERNSENLPNDFRQIIAIIHMIIYTILILLKFKCVITGSSVNLFVRQYKS